MGYKIICTMLSHHKQKLNFIPYEQKCAIYFKTAGTNNIWEASRGLCWIPFLCYFFSLASHVRKSHLLNLGSFLSKLKEKMSGRKEEKKEKKKERERDNKENTFQTIKYHTNKMFQWHGNSRKLRDGTTGSWKTSK